MIAAVYATAELMHGVASIVGVLGALAVAGRLCGLAAAWLLAAYGPAAAEREE